MGCCALKWSHIDWENSAILLPCPKTEDYEGRETRLVPLFPELRQELEAWRHEAPKDSEFVLKPAVNPKTNLRTGLLKILKRAGIQPWPKLFQNLRSTRATELRDKGYREHLVAEWLGHTVKVADDHYDQVTAEHFRRAVEPQPKPPSSQGAA